MASLHRLAATRKDMQIAAAENGQVTARPC